MDIRSFQLFISLAETLHFGRASEAMHVSPSTLSRHIQRLEEALDCRLFARDNRSVQLTQQGRIAYELCQNIVAQWQQLQQDLSGQDSLMGQLRLYCSVTAAQLLMRQFIEKFRPNYPKIALSVETGDAAVAIDHVVAQRTDIAIAALPDELPEGVSFAELTTSPLLFIRPSYDCEVRQKTLQCDYAWSELPMIVAQVGLSRERLLAWFKTRNEHPNIYAEVAGHEAIVAMVGLGLGVGLIPQAVFEQSALRDQVEVFSVPADIAAYRVSICCLQRRLQDPVLAAFWKTVTE